MAVIEGMDKFLRRLDRLDRNRVERKFHTIAGNHGLAFFQQSFRRQGFIDERFEKWEARKNSEPGQSRKVLVKTSELKGSIRIVKSSQGRVVFGSDLPYAKIHNEGGKVSGTYGIRKHRRRAFNRKVRGKHQSVKAHDVKSHSRKVNFKIPQRQFMGSSRVLGKRIILHLRKSILRDYKRF